MLTFYPSRIQGRKGSGSATLLLIKIFKGETKVYFIIANAGDLMVIYLFTVSFLLHRLAPDQVVEVRESDIRMDADGNPSKYFKN
jgi:hypothetical protein